MLKLSVSRAGLQVNPKVPALALPPPEKAMLFAADPAQLCQVALQRLDAKQSSTHVVQNVWTDDYGRC